MSNGGGQFWSFQFIDANGNPYSGVKVYHYAAGTTTEKAVWTDEGKASAGAQPVVGDSRGLVSFYADGDYKIVVKDTNDNTLYTWDNVKITSDTGILWEGNYGTTYPPATVANRWQEFIKYTNLNELIEVGINTGSAFKPLIPYVIAHFFSSFTNAVAAASGKTLVVAESVNLDANTTIPPNVAVMPLYPGVINANGYTLTINGPVVVTPMHQWLSGFAAGEVTFGVGIEKIYATWFGHVGDGTTYANNRTAGQMAIDAAPDGCTIVFPGKTALHPSYNTTTHNLNHSGAGGGSSVNYLSVWKVRDKSNLRIVGDFAEVSDPNALNTYYYVFLMQNCLNCEVDGSLTGYVSLDSDNDYATNSGNSAIIDQKGPVGVYILDRCIRTTVNLKCKSVHAAVFNSAYGGDDNWFDDIYRPYGTNVEINIEDSLYGFMTTGNFDHAVITGLNIKRPYRCQAGRGHQFKVNIGTSGHFSWTQIATVLIDCSDSDKLITENVIGDITIQDMTGIIECDVSAFNATLRNVNLCLACSDGEIQIRNDGNSSTANQTIKDIRIHGRLLSRSTVPVRLVARKHSNDTQSSIQDVDLSGLNIESTASPTFDYPIKFENGINYNYKRIRLANMTIKGTTNNVNRGDGYVGGTLLINNVDDLIIGNITHILNGFSSTNSMAIVNCRTIHNIGGIVTPGVLVYSSPDMDNVAPPIPKMTSSEISNIANPEQGLMVYDKTNNIIQYYTGSAWKVVTAT